MSDLIIKTNFLDSDEQEADEEESEGEVSPKNNKNKDKKKDKGRAKAQSSPSLSKKKEKDNPDSKKKKSSKNGGLGVSSSPSMSDKKSSKLKSRPRTVTSPETTSGRLSILTFFERLKNKNTIQEEPSPFTTLSTNSINLFAANYGNIVQTWDIETLKIFDERMLETSDSIFSLTTDDDPNQPQVFFVGLENGTVEKYDLRVKKRVAKFDVQIKMITSIRVHKSLLISASYDTTVAIWDLRNVSSAAQSSFFGQSTIAEIKEHKEPMSSLTVIDDMLITSARERIVKIWSLKDFSKLGEIKQDQSPKLLLSYPNEKLLYCLGDADYVQVWEIGEGGTKIKRLQELQLKRDLITSACLSDQYLFTSCSNGWIDVYSRQLVKQIDTRTSCRLEQVRFANSYLFASREKGDIHVYKQNSLLL